MPISSQGVGGGGLGNAFGRIRIDTSDVTRGSTAVRSAALDVEKSFARIGRSAKAAQTDVILVASSMSQVRNHMAGLPSTVRPATAALVTVGTTAKTASVGVAGLGATLSGLAGTMGLMFGVAAITQLGRFALSISEVATTYRRQSVAALSLAGSQAQLNELMRAYDRATGGAIDKAAALADVTRLQAIGFADTAEELERFTLAARGIALAMGRTQEYVISQLQLTIANQSTMRLDQIGLGIAEVENRIASLRAENSLLTKEMAYQEAVLSLAEEKYGALATSIEAQATGAEAAAGAWKDLRLELGLLTGGQIGAGMNALASDLGRVNKALEITAFLSEQVGLNLGDGRLGQLFNLALPGLSGQREIALFRLAFDKLYQAYEVDVATQEAMAFDTGRFDEILMQSDRRSSGAGGPKYTADQAKAVQKWADSIQDIENQASKARLAATETYEKRRTDVIASYERTIARDAEDFARQRARQAADLARNIADIRKDALEQEREWGEDYAETVADIRGDSNDKIAEIEEDYNRERERRARDYRDNLLSAAGRLDASAILAEKRRFARESGDADKGFEESRSKEQEALDERLVAEKKSYDEQLQLSRENTAEQIRDIEEAADLQRRRGDEDRAIRLRRQAENHTLQLEQLDTAHVDRLIQIDRQAADEREKLDESFRQQMIDLGIANEGWETLQRARQETSLELFKDWWDEIDEIINERMMANVPPARPDGPARAYASGGYVPSTGLAQLHAGEYVLNARTTRMLDTMMGGVNQQNLISMAGNRSVSLALHQGAIQVNAAPGQDASTIAVMVRQEIAGLLQEVT